jgi:hypothetical protein
MKEALGSSETSVLTRAKQLTSQKTPFFIVTAVKTSNLTFPVARQCSPDWTEDEVRIGKLVEESRDSETGHSPQGFVVQKNEVHH